MNDEPTDFDLKFMPDWLKEAPAKNPYADYESKEYDRPRRDFNGPRPSRPGQAPRGDRDRKPGGPGGRTDRPRDDKRGPQQKPGQSKQGPYRGDRPRDQRPGGFQKPAPPVEVTPAAVTVEFLPDSNCVTSIARQIKATSHACPLFGLAKMFLARPERHRVRITSADAAIPLFQCGENGPVATDRSILEKNAFTSQRDRFYARETVQREPLKGNFNNVARCKLSGKLLGPTNYHAYQPTLRKLYEERFSRRMPFPEYLRQIEISTNPEAIEAWKEEARSITTYKTLTEQEPVVFETAAAVEQHFRKNYLEQLIQSGQTFEIPGEVSRNLPDRHIATSVKQAWEKELQFPGQLMHHLRRELTEAGLHIFKHRKRMQFISVIRPDRFKGSLQTVSGNIAAILETIEATPKCTRVDLANKILQSKQDDPDLPKLKTALAADLHWLTHAGHVIEFQDGKLDLPLAPKQLEKEAAEAASETHTAPVKAPASVPSVPSVPEPVSKESEAAPVESTEPPVTTISTPEALPAPEPPTATAEAQDTRVKPESESAPETDPEK
ncbi:MAG: hypothetical protein WCH43_05590 [Verrucomicrobiota bacterium]